MRIDLTGESVLVTGGSGGIGEAIVRELSGAGAKVAFQYRRDEERARWLVERGGGGVTAHRADFGNGREVVRLFEEATAALGRIDLLVNSAGIFKAAPVTGDPSDWMERWDETVAVNLTAAGILCRLAIERFIEQGGGRIVTIASRAAFRGETADYLAYAASKGGLVSLGRSIARSFGKLGIKSFIIAPGWVRTKMTEAYLDDHEEEIVERELALGALTKPDDIAPTVAFIAAGLLDHATGCTIDMNAGSYIR